MKNKIFFVIFLNLFFNPVFAEGFDITAKEISIDKKNQITIFKNNVVIIDQNKNTIKAEYAKYDKIKNFFELKKNVQIEDKNGNIFFSENANYDKNSDVFLSIGETKINSKMGYNVITSDLTYDLKNKFVSSKNKTEIIDIDKNFIFLENFEYLTNENIFKSIGEIKVEDKMNNSYKFSQIYINEKSKEIIGTDAKAFLNNNQFKFNKDNKPRVFSNVINIKNDQTKFIKSNFTLCNYRKNDKCPPWELLASKMIHDNKKKTIYYDNAIVKVYNVPIFYIPKLSHPDPTVDRRSGFLNPSFSETKNLGSNVNIPYFFNIGKDKDLTINSRLFFSEHPLFIGEYRQAFKNSNLTTEFGYTQGYKRESSTKKLGDKSHFFSKFTKNFVSNENKETNIELNVQHVSNKKYLKLYKIDSNLIDYETNVLENYLDFSHYNDEDNFSFHFNTSVYRSLADSYNDKYEYVIPNITLNKFFASENYGYGNLQSNFKIRNYDTNKFERFLENDLDWSFDKSLAKSFYNGKFLAKLKNFSYQTENIEKYKSDFNSELFGAVGYLASIDLFKNENMASHFLKPKLLFKYAPNFMKKETEEFTLYGKDIFSLDRLDTNGNLEGGTSLTLGLDYQKKVSQNDFNFSIGQIINEKKGNKNMPPLSSLDKRFSDVVGSLSYNNNNFKAGYDFTLDQNYKELNYNNISANYENNKIEFNINYLEEERLSENREYVSSSFAVKSGKNSSFAITNKRNLITNSSEYYKLSYEYTNDCLKAGLVYRREFYEDSELEPENSLMFTITLSPLGALSSPTFNK